MPQIAGAVAVAAWNIGFGGATAVAIGNVVAAGVQLAALAAVSAYSAKAQAKAMDEDGGFQAREQLVSGAKETQTVVYGEAWCGGVVMYDNQRHTPGTKDNFELYIAIAHAAHECEAITDLYYDNEILRDGVEIDWGAGHVVAGKFGVTKAGVYATSVERQYGTTAQGASSFLTGAFPSDFTAAHTTPGIACTIHKFVYFSDSATAPEDIFYSGPPRNIRAKIKGRRIYDPRLDSTNGGSGAHRYADPTTWAWSDNPILCWTDYLTQYKPVAFSKIDWDWVRAQADICDVLVSVPSGTQKRYACNGVISLGMTHEQIREDILSSCLGTCPKVNGKWRPTAGAYGSIEANITEDDIVGPVTVTTSRSREDRYNVVKAVYFSSDSYAQEVDALPVTSSTYVTLDGGELPPKAIALLMTTNEYAAQRIAFKHLLQSRQQITCTVPLKWTGLRIYPGLRLQLTYSKYGWSRKVFRCIGWTFGGESPVSVVLVEDSALAWLDPTTGQYSTRDAAGVVTAGTVELPNPTAGGGAGEITIRNPGFEFGDTQWTLDNGWEIVRDTSSAHSGDWVARHVGAPTVPGDAFCIAKEYVPVKPGQLVKAGGFVKTSSDFAGGSMIVSPFVQYTDSNKAYISNDGFAAVLTAGQAWQQVANTSTVPVGATYAQFVFYVNKGAGTVWVDDAFLDVRSGSTIGVDVVDSGGNVVDDDGLLNANLVTASAAQYFSWSSSDGSTYVPASTDFDLTAYFTKADGTQMATHTVRGTRSGNTVSIATLSTAGGTTTLSSSGSGTATATATISYAGPLGTVTSVLIWSVISTFTGGGGPSK